MNLEKIITELRERRDLVDDAIVVFERLALQQQNRTSAMKDAREAVGGRPRSKKAIPKQ